MEVTLRSDYLSRSNGKISPRYYEITYSTNRDTISFNISTSDGTREKLSDIESRKIIVMMVQSECTLRNSVETITGFIKLWEDKLIIALRKIDTKNRFGKDDWFVCTIDEIFDGLKIRRVGGQYDPVSSLDIIDEAFLDKSLSTLYGKLDSNELLDTLEKIELKQIFLGIFEDLFKGMIENCKYTDDLGHMQLVSKG